MILGNYKKNFLEGWKMKFRLYDKMDETVHMLTKQQVLNFARDWEDEISAGENRDPDPIRNFAEAVAYLKLLGYKLI